MAFITIESPDENIWKTNPALELISEFKSFKEKEGEERSSNIIKAIFYIWDPKSTLRDSGVSEQQLVKDITENIIKDSKFNWDDYDYIREIYQTNNISKIESLLLRYEKEITDLNGILENWKWDKKNIKDRALAVSQYKVLFDEYIDIQEQVLNERENKIQMEGGYKKSLIESYGEK